MRMIYDERGVCWLLALAAIVCFLACSSDNGDTEPNADAADTSGADLPSEVGVDIDIDLDAAPDTTDDADTGLINETGDARADSPSMTECNESNPGHTIGLLTCLPEAHDGYTLFAPIGATTVYLIDMLGRVAHSWDTEYSPGNVVYLLESGNLLVTGDYSPRLDPRLRAGGSGGIVQKIDWHGTVLWSFEYSTDEHRQHHDVELLPNGNVLMVAWEYKSTGEAVAQGRDSARAASGLWPDTVIEVEPTGPEDGQIVWEWHAWDHLIQDYQSGLPNFGVVGNHPELIDLNFGRQSSPDWLHINSVAYNATLDQIALSVHNTGEVWIIDHSTTTAEAAAHVGGDQGMGGDLLYRWGNPQIYDAATRGDQWLFGQHDAHWISDGFEGAGNILMFDNGMGRGGSDFSRIVEITPPLLVGGDYDLRPGSAYEPVAPAWLYEGDPPETFYSQNISGSQRLANGNTLICSGATGRFFEVTAEGDIVWEYVNPIAPSGPLSQGQHPGRGRETDNSVFRAYRYDADYRGLVGKDLTPGDVLEL